MQPLWSKDFSAVEPSVWAAGYMSVEGVLTPVWVQYPWERWQTALSHSWYWIITWRRQRLRPGLTSLCPRKALLTWPCVHLGRYTMNIILLPSRDYRGSTEETLWTGAASEPRPRQLWWALTCPDPLTCPQTLACPDPLPGRWRIPCFLGVSYLI